MTEETFTELVNLYLDKEISEEDLARLQAELAVDSERQQSFRERCRLHRAMQLALNPGLSQTQKAQGAQRPTGPSPVRWLSVAGLAASLVVAFTLIPILLTERAESSLGGIGSSPPGVSIPGVDSDYLLDEISLADVRRYAARHEKNLANRRASLAAQLRLMGLRPELIPQDKDLRAVDLAAIQPKPTRSQAELLTEVQRHSVIPKPRILRLENTEGSNIAQGSQGYSGGFSASQVSFR